MSEDPWSPRAWNAPCFESVRSLLDELNGFDRWPTLAELDAGWFGEVHAASGARLRLVPQPTAGRRRGERSRDALYDARIARGELPTRERSWHDLLNLAMFRAFSSSKAALHARHHAILLERVPARFERLPGARTREQDALALLDEGGVVVAVPPARFDAAEGALRSGQLIETAVLRSAPDTRVWVLGHALLEHAALASLEAARGPEPRALAVVVAAASPHDRATVDRALATRLAERTFLSEPPGYPSLPLSRWCPPRI